MEQLRRAWLIELGELSSIKRSDVEQVKAYLSKQVDIYRAAYGRRVSEHPRQCVFCGTTNEALFLKGDNGNRRFWVIPVNAALRKYHNWHEALTRDRDQLWAEAVHYYKQGERLYLSDELEAQAKQRQQEFNDDSDDPIVAMLTKYLDTRLPVTWDTMDVQARRSYLRDPDPLQADGTELRERVCAAEFICEQMGKDMTDKDYKYLARRICKIIDGLPDWERISSTRHVQQLYGVQKGFRRKPSAENEDDL